jgi:hypothetical protein
MAKLAGVTCIGLISTDEKTHYAKEPGMEHVTSYKSENVAAHPWTASFIRSCTGTRVTGKRRCQRQVNFKALSRINKKTQETLSLITLKFHPSCLFYFYCVLHCCANN